MKKQSLIQGAFILSTVGLINRLLGFVLRVILVKIIGDEGLGIFQMVYPFYITLLLISSTGFPLAITKLIPEKKETERKSHALYLLKIAFISVSFTSGLTVLFAITKSNYIATSLLSDSRTYYTVLILSPALFVTTVASILRSFFQGFQNMVPTAISQLTEQLCRFAATIIIISMTASLQLSYQAAGVAAGIVIGESAGLIFLIVYFIFWYSRERKKLSQISQGDNLFSTYKKIAALALPVTGGRIVHSLIRSFEAILIPVQLKLSGLSQAGSTALFGQLTGMVEQIIFLPTVITTGLTISLIPSISKDYANRNFIHIKKNYNDILRIISYMGIPAALFFYIYGTEICGLLFGYPEAGIILSSLAAASPFIYYLQVSSGMLNGLGKPLVAVRNITIGSVVKIILIYLLVSDPAWRITGAAAASSAGYIIGSIFNYCSIKFTIKYRLNFISIIAKPLFSALIVYFSHHYIAELAGLIPGIGIYGFKEIYLLLIAGFLYLVLMILLKAITVDDLKKLKF